MVKTKRVSETSKTHKNVFNKVIKKSLKPDTSSDLNPKTGFQKGDYKPNKKPFNKSKWRKEKYSFKSKLEKWQNKRVDYIKHEYAKQKNQSQATGFDVQKIYEEEERRQQDESPDEEKKLEDWKLRKQERFIAMQKMREERRQELAKMRAEKALQDEDRSEAKKLEDRKLRKQERFIAMQKMREERRQELAKMRAEKEEALTRYKQKKIEKQRKLNLRTKKGQPVMKGRIELLLEKIQASMN